MILTAFSGVAILPCWHQVSQSSSLELRSSPNRSLDKLQTHRKSVTPVLCRILFKAHESICVLQIALHRKVPTGLFY